jgi:uncharacterized protein YecE (DUF72 family)
MRVLAGTSGYAYKEWKGSFYPEDLKPDQYLGHYASRLGAVEINNTFYRMPTERLLLGWAAQVPDGFTFVLKASQKITHRKRLADCAEEVAYFLRTANVLGKRMGPTLFQMPPNFKKDLGRLKAFLEQVPRTWRAAFEFRHDSWFDNEVFEALRAHGNAALCVADVAPEEGPAAPLVATADWGYLRLRREDYTPDSLADWARKVSEQPWREALVFFKHEEAGAGPRLAQQFLGLLLARQSDQSATGGAAGSAT